MNPQSNGSRWSIVLLQMALAGLAHFDRIAISVAGAEVFLGAGGISETRTGWVYTPRGWEWPIS